MHYKARKCTRCNRENTSDHPSIINRPAIEPGRVSYVIVNNYRTNFDDFCEVYLFGIQVDRGLSKEAGH